MLKQSLNHINSKLDKLLANTGDMALKRRARRIFEELDLQDGDNILEVGCGDGYYLHILSNLGLRFKLTGVDYNPLALKSAKRNLKGKKVKLGFADLMQSLPFRANSFDKVIMSEVAEHLPDDIKGLKEVRRVLKKGGMLIVTVPNHNYPFLWDPVNWVLEHFFGTHIGKGFWAGLWNQHLRLYKPDEIKRSVKMAGFDIKKVESITWWSLPFNHNIMHLAARKLYGGDLSPKTARAVSKFEKTTHDKKPFFIDLAFQAVNLIDKLNDIYQPKNYGVGVLVKAIK